MKTKVIMIVAILSIALTSCKNENKSKTNEDAIAPKEEVKQNFSVELDVISERDDSFAMYYTEDGTIAFNLDHVVWGGVKGGADSQKVVFTLSEEIIPTHIRLDFGLKKGAEQGDVTLRNVKVMNYGKSFEFKGSDFLKYFIENKEVKTEINAANGTIKFLKNPAVTTTPFYYPTQVLIDEIAKITK
jgi:hypothetical protein